ncbi:MAG: CoA ester lyase [Burkholderiaceae bacterium]|nr:CoA ester lyase [Pseudomonadota bacterium]MBS0598678.1 CoA ester lyase [Pseudomonadota bacterium]MCO5115959.1 CoA ester lyase [Burkholderiaceae bacterium]MCP5216953.1 CoA ester lyase [Burkholderiaceae bacterium]
MIRSLFFAPANRPDLVVKFPRFGADCCVIDLEDGTPPGEKIRAREMLASTVAQVRTAGLKSLLMVRVNVPDSMHYLADLEAAFMADVDGVVIPKLEAPEQAFPAQHWITRRDAEAPRAQPRSIVGGIESVRGVLNAAALCQGVESMGSVFFGAEDFAADIGGRRTPRGDEVYTARSMVVMAARAAGLIAIDQAVIDIRNDALFLEDAARGRDLGYEGKICVTPGQVKLAHRAFSPMAEERDYAQRLVDTYESAMARGLGTIDFEGRMIDGPTLKRAQQVLALPVEGT